MDNSMPNNDLKPCIRAGSLQVTLTALVFRRWWVDNESPYHERLVFLDGLTADRIGTIHYVRAWWALPLDDLSYCEELGKFPIGSILAMSSNHTTLESAEDFHFDEGPVPEDSPQVAINMKAPVFSLVAPGELEANLIELFLAGLKSFVPEDVVSDRFQSEVEKFENPLTHEFIIQKLTNGSVGS